MADIPIINPADKDEKNFLWCSQFTIPLLFDDCLSDLQKLCALYTNQQILVNSLNDWNTDFKKWALSIESDINALQSDKAKNTILIGDSYGDGYTPDGAVKSWIEILKDTYFTDGKNFSSNEGGSGFVAVGQNGNTFLKQLQKVVDSMSPDDIENCGKIIVGGGWNDIFHADQVNTITNAISIFVKTASRLVPNATCYISFIATTGWKNITTHALYQKWVNCKTAYATTWLPYKNLYGADMALRWTGVMSSDFIHPNSIGQGSIADSIYKAINGANFTIRKAYDFYISSELGTPSYNQVKFTITNGHAVASLGDLTRGFVGITFNAPVTFNANTVLFTHDITCISEESHCTCQCIYETAGKVYHQTTAVLTINRDDGTAKDYNKIRIFLFDGNAFPQNVVSIQLYGAQFEFTLI